MTFYSNINSLKVIKQLLTNIEYIACFNSDNPIFKTRSKETLRNLIINLDCEISIINIAIRLVETGNHRFITKKIAAKYDYSKYYKYTPIDLENEKNNLYGIRQLIKHYSREKGLI